MENRGEFRGGGNFSTCQQSIGNIGANFGENLIEFSRGAVLRTWASKILVRKGLAELLREFSSCNRMGILQ